MLSPRNDTGDLMNRTLRLRALAAIAVAVFPMLALAQQASPAFNEKALAADTRFLSSDALEGRGPGTRGDALAVAYIAAQFEAAGLEPAGDNGSYMQKVPLIGITTDPAKTSLSFMKTGAPSVGPLVHLDQFVGADQTQSGSSLLDSELVFVGHGVVAPEYKWDDYKGLDARGKTLVMLVDDPAASTAEPDLFKGIARTYYGRWTYKYEIGTAKNADGVILIHTDKAAGYGWSVVRNSWSGEESYMKRRDGAHALQFSGWITGTTAGELFKAAGFDLAKLTAAADRRDFKPVALGGYRLQGTITSAVRPFETNNVIGRLQGSDPKLRDEAVLYTAHHDHLGIGKADESGDVIYNGAVDNASGTALLMEMARVWSASPARPKRSILFAAVSAEEQGLLGSLWLGTHPPIPAGRIAVALNYDAIDAIGRVSDVVMIGSERTTFYPTVQKVAAASGLSIVPDQAPEQGSYYRSDHFSVAKAGVPAFSIKHGHTVIGAPPGTGKAWAEEYRKKRYHQPGDEMDSTWNFGTAAQMGEFGYQLGMAAANAGVLPTWNAGDEFLAARERSMK